MTSSKVCAKLYHTMTKQKKQATEKAATEKDLVKVKPFLNAKGLAEIFQSMAVKICLVKREEDGSFTEIAPFVQCYDFIVDSYSSSEQKYNFEIYGYSWDGSKNSPNWDEVLLHVKFPSSKSKNCFKNNLHFLHKIENDNHIPHTIIKESGNLTFIVEGNKAWLANCLTLRLYLFLFRCFSYDIKGDDWLTDMSGRKFSDSAYIKNLNRETWDKILSDLSSIHTKKFCGLSFAKDGVDAVHHNSGFFSTFSYHTEMDEYVIKQNPHWKEMKKRGFKLYTN